MQSQHKHLALLQRIPTRKVLELPSASHAQELACGRHDSNHTAEHYSGILNVTVPPT